jgi:hypothetical protein
MLDIPAEELSECSTENPNWKEESDKFLETKGLFFVQVMPNDITIPPDKTLVGVSVDGVRDAHIVVARVFVKRDGSRYGLEVVFDPAGKRAVGTLITEYLRLTLFCKLIK